MQVAQVAEATQAIGVLGGTFNPVHFGHLRVATEFSQAFQLQKVALMPCYIPVHREIPDIDSIHRVRMLELAVANTECLYIDEREIKAGAASYTVDSLTGLRQEVGEQVAIYFIMGEDAFGSFTQWYRWQDILSLANIVVLSRPGVDLDFSQQPWQEFSTFSGKHSSFGMIYKLDVTPLAISSTAIRQYIQQQQSICYLVPDSVAEYIKEHKLYQKL